MEHRPLHLVGENQSQSTAGRLRKSDQGWEIVNAFVALDLELEATEADSDNFVDGALVRVGGHRQGRRFVVEAIEIIHEPTVSFPALGANRAIPLGVALRERAALRSQIRRFFDDRGVLEVQTPALVQAPGTDPHIEPVPARFFSPYNGDESQLAFLHTSPELSMKRLLSAGSGPIYQLSKVWRNGEITDLHNPEFSLLEWYRPWQDIDAIIEDVEHLVCQVLDEKSDSPVTAPIKRMTMQEVVAKACGFDLLEALDTDGLRRQIKERELLSDRAMDVARWDELFFSLTVSHIDPYLREQGAVFVIDWPAPLAILAKKNNDDPRTAQRFELYVDGVELANGFGELTDPVEQRQRFVADNQTREELGIRPLPIAESFLHALEWGLPPSAGVALGVDRLLMLATPGAERLRDIAPFALTRENGEIRWP